MSAHFLHRLLQIGTGLLLGVAVVSVAILGVPFLDSDPAPTAMVVSADGSFEPYPAPPLALETSDGSPFTNEELTGEVSVVFFGFASCPDVCPITLGNLSRAQDRLNEDALSFQGVFVSVDPRRDTPEVLDRYMSLFHPDLVAVTGPEEVVHEVARDWGIHVAFSQASEGSDPHAHHAPPGMEAPGDHGEEAGSHSPTEDDSNLRGVPDPASAAEGLPFPSDAEDYVVDHTARSLVVDRHGRIVDTLAPYLSPEEIVAILRPHLDS